MKNATTFSDDPAGIDPEQMLRLMKELEEMEDGRQKMSKEFSDRLPSIIVTLASFCGTRVCTSSIIPKGMIMIGTGNDFNFSIQNYDVTR